MSEKLTNLLERLDKAQANVDKRYKTIEKYYVQLEKRVRALNAKGIMVSWEWVRSLPLETADYKQMESFIEVLRPFQRDAKGELIQDYWDVSELCIKLEDVKSAYQKVRETEQIRDNWKVKVVAEQTKIDFANSAHPLIIECVKRWGTYVYNWLLSNTRYPNEEMIRKQVESEMHFKIIQLHHQITGVVGDITDVSGVHIAEKGELNGLFIGTKGRARVETIGAGGYNIQKFHFRTLVHKV